MIDYFLIILENGLGANFVYITDLP